MSFRDTYCVLSNNCLKPRIRVLDASIRLANDINNTPLLKTVAPELRRQIGGGRERIMESKKGLITAVSAP